MKTLGEVSQLGYIVLGIYAIILLTASTIVLVNSCTMHLRKRNRFAAMLLTLMSIAMLILVAGKFDVDEEMYISSITERVGLDYIFFAFVLLTAAIVGQYMRQVIDKRKIITKMTVKESLDALPDAVCFFTCEGLPLLMNTEMIRFCNELTGAGMMNAYDFLNLVGSGKIKTGRMLSENTSLSTIETEDGRVRQLNLTELDVDGYKVNEMIAYDITDMYRLTQRLIDNNEKMDAICKRLGKFSENLYQLTHEKEVLDAIVRVHDDLGRALLALRKYLVNDEGESRAKEREQLLFLWRYNTAVLNMETSPANDESWIQVTQTAERMGVSVKVHGNLPCGLKQLELVIAALQTCLTNTVEHANGNEINVLFTESSDRLTVEFKNNGRPPRGRIQEGGGLRGLRSKVERAGGTMLISSLPEFILRLEIPVAMYEFDSRNKRCRAAKG